MTTPTIQVKSHGSSNVGHIEFISLVYQSDDVILFDIDLKTKYKDVSGYGGATDKVSQSLWIGMDEVQIILPKGFGRHVIYAEASRYTVHVCIGRSGLWDKMVESGAILWESNK
jgi:hypothetical protein